MSMKNITDCNQSKVTYCNRSLSALYDHRDPFAVDEFFPEREAGAFHGGDDLVFLALENAGKDGAAAGIEVGRNGGREVDEYRGDEVRRDEIEDYIDTSNIALNHFYINTSVIQSNVSSCCLDCERINVNGHDAFIAQVRCRDGQEPGAGPLGNQDQDHGDHPRRRDGPGGRLEA